MELFDDEFGKFTLEVATLNIMQKTGEIFSNEQRTKCKIIRNLISAYNKLLNNINISADTILNGTKSNTDSKKNDDQTTSYDDTTKDFQDHIFENQINSLFGLDHYYNESVGDEKFPSSYDRNRTTSPKFNSSSVSVNNTSIPKNVEESTTTDEDGDRQISILAEYDMELAKKIIEGRWVNYDVFDKFYVKDDNILDSVIENKKNDARNAYDASSSYDTSDISDISNNSDIDNNVDSNFLPDSNNSLSRSSTKIGTKNLTDDSEQTSHDDITNMNKSAILADGKNINLIYEIATQSMGLQRLDNNKILLSDNSVENQRFSSTESTSYESYDGSSDAGNSDNSGNSNGWSSDEDTKIPMIGNGNCYIKDNDKIYMQQYSDIYA